MATVPCAFCFPPPALRKSRHALNAIAHMFKTGGCHHSKIEALYSASLATRQRGVPSMQFWPSCMCPALLFALTAPYLNFSAASPLSPHVICSRPCMPEALLSVDDVLGCFTCSPSSCSLRRRVRPLQAAQCSRRSLFKSACCRWATPAAPGPSPCSTTATSTMRRTICSGTHIPSWFRAQQLQQRRLRHPAPPQRLRSCEGTGGTVGPAERMRVQHEQPVACNS